MEFSLLDIIKYYLKNIYFILIGLIIFLLLGILYTSKYVEYEYESDTDILVGSCSYDCDILNYDDLELANGLINGYMELIKSKRVIQLVIDELKLEIDYKELRDSINVSHEKDSYFINIAVKNNDGEISSLIANELVKKLAIVAKDIYKVENIYVVNEAKISNDVINKDLYYYIIFMLIGFVISSLIVLIGFGFDRRIINNSSKEFFGISILGYIKFRIFDKNKRNISNINDDVKFLDIRNKFLLFDENKKSYLFSSVDKSDVSYTIMNVARTLSKLGNKILIIDCNLDARLTKLYKLDKSKGLFDYLKGRIKIENIISKIVDEDISLIPIGLCCKYELLGTNKFSKLLSLLEDKYDYILIDTKNIDKDLNVRSILINKLDIILVCTEYRTKIDNIYRLLDDVKNSKSIVKGIVIYNR